MYNLLNEYNYSTKNHHILKNICHLQTEIYECTVILLCCMYILSLCMDLTALYKQYKRYRARQKVSYITLQWMQFFF